MLHQTFIKRASVLLIVGAMLALLVFPAAAQNFGENTITVTGNGSATARPDMATIEIGVEVPNTDIAAAYSEVNQNIEMIVEALVELGVAREDIRTTGLNIYSEGGYGMEGQVENRYRVGNRVSVIVRDLALIESVIDTAVNSGANQVFGLQFGISDTKALETEARAEALDDARSRAGEIASNIGVELGDITMVVENYGGGYMPLYNGGFGGGGDMASVEPGQLTVNLTLQVSFQMNR